jgi:hypothetical protein
VSGGIPSLTTVSVAAGDDMHVSLHVGSSGMPMLILRGGGCEFDLHVSPAWVNARIVALCQDLATQAAAFCGHVEKLHAACQAADSGPTGPAAQDSAAAGTVA